MQEAGLMPTVDIIEMFALQMPGEKFSSLLVSKRLQSKRLQVLTRTTGKI